MLTHLRRLEHIRDLLRARQGVDARHTHLLCFGADFTDDLRAAAATTDTIHLVDPARLYHGD